MAATNNKKADTNGITTAKAIADTERSKTFTKEEIKRILFELVCDFDPTSGEYMISGTGQPVEESCLNKVTFVNTLDSLIDAIAEGDAYTVLNSISKLTSKKYATDMGLCVQAIERNTKNNFIKEIPLTEVIFEDELLNIFWKSLSPLMKRAACLLLTAITHLEDRYWEIPCFNYNGDSCNFYGCLDSNKFSFFQGRIPGTERKDFDDEF